MRDPVHVFTDWRFVDEERWRDVHDALNGTGVESMQGKWDEMFGTKARPEQIEKKTAEETARARKPRQKPATKIKETRKRALKRKLKPRPRDV